MERVGDFDNYRSSLKLLLQVKMKKRPMWSDSTEVEKNAVMMAQKMAVSNYTELSISLNSVDAIERFSETDGINFNTCSRQ